jgi:hypothetical protein
MSSDSPAPPGEPGWWIIAKIALFVAVPIGLVYLVKLLME